MNKQEYTEYKARVEKFITDNKIEVYAPDINEQGENISGFSWQPCECCGSPLGGDRFSMIYKTDRTDNTVSTFQVCIDCLYFLEYGRLDDMTMLEIEQ